MTRGGEALLTTMDEIGARIQPEPGWRDDVITFESEPLDHDLHIQGAISVDLYVFIQRSGHRLHGQAHVRRGPGRHRARLPNFHHHDRAGYAGRRAVQAGRNPPREHRHVGHLLDGARPGSRIRCDISSSDFPRYSVHTNHAGLWSEQTGTQVAHQTIHMGGATPSAIVLPVRG